jgi:hypothetical protein
MFLRPVVSLRRQTRVPRSRASAARGQPLARCSVLTRGTVGVIVRTILPRQDNPCASRHQSGANQVNAYTR